MVRSTPLKSAAGIKVHRSNSNTLLSSKEMSLHLSIFPQEKAKETLAAIKTNSVLIKHDLV